MSDWQPNLYLEFGKERTQPSIDLVTRIHIENPKRILDVGCGPGNSTNVLKARWSNVEIIGVDNSEAMIDQAKAKYPEMEWLCADASGNLSALGSFDVVFSNAAIQWIPKQESLLTKLFGMLNKGGVLAVQVPYTEFMPINTEIKKLTTTEKWKNYFTDMTSTHSIHTANSYYNMLCNLSEDIDLWETRYFHVMNTHADIVKWYSSTGLRPYSNCLKDSNTNAEFINEYENALKAAYPVQSNGKILFPFTRIFFIAKNV